MKAEEMAEAFKLHLGFHFTVLIKPEWKKAFEATRKKIPKIEASHLFPTHKNISLYGTHLNHLGCGELILNAKLSPWSSEMGEKTTLHINDFDYASYEISTLSHYKGVDHENCNRVYYEIGNDGFRVKTSVDGASELEDGFDITYSIEFDIQRIVFRTYGIITGLLPTPVFKGNQGEHCGIDPYEEGSGFTWEMKTFRTPPTFRNPWPRGKAHLKNEKLEIEVQVTPIVSDNFMNALQHFYVLGIGPDWTVTLPK